MLTQSDPETQLVNGNGDPSLSVVTLVPRLPAAPLECGATLAACLYITAVAYLAKLG